MKFFGFILALLVAASAPAATVKISNMSRTNDIANGDLFEMSRAVGASYATRAISGSNVMRMMTNVANAVGGGGGLAISDLATSNYFTRALISDATPQDPYRWMNLTNGLLRFPAWSSDRIVGSLTPGIHFYSVTNGADHFSIDVQHDHAAAGKSEARMIFLWDGAIVPGYNSGVQLGASTDNYNQEFHIQYANRMGWSHLFNFRGNTNGNIGSISLQGRRISTTTNLSELWIWANEPTWNSYPTPGFSAVGPQIAKLAIGGTYFYSDLWTPRTIVTNRQLIGAGPMFYTTDGGMELSSGYSDGFMVGADIGSATRTTGASKYFWMTMTPKTHSDPRQNILSVANDSSTTATLYIGGGSSAVAPLNRVKIYAGADSTATGTGSLGIDVSNGQVATTNLAVTGTLSVSGTANGALSIYESTGADLRAKIDGDSLKLTNGSTAWTVTLTNGGATFSSNVVAAKFYGNGSGLTNLPTATLLGWTTNIGAANSISNGNSVTLGNATAATVAATTVYTGITNSSLATDANGKMIAGIAGATVKLPMGASVSSSAWSTTARFFSPFGGGSSATESLVWLTNMTSMIITNTQILFGSNVGAGTNFQVYARTNGVRTAALINYGFPGGTQRTPLNTSSAAIPANVAFDFECVGDNAITTTVILGYDAILQ